MRLNKLNRLCFLILSILLITNMIHAQDDINSYEYLKLEINNNIEFDLNLDKEVNVEKFEVSSYFLPTTYNDSQYLNEFTTNFDNYKILEEENNLFLKFYIDESTIKTKNQIKNNFIIESTKFEPKIITRANYPIVNIDDKYDIYLEFNGLIDIDDNIKNKASSLASGEDDTYLIAAKIAKWIREDIIYDLSTVTENPNQKSSQVFQSKTGVCKEISNLYISMMRSLGIPARIVTGYAYTDSQDIVNFVGSNWGGHAWTEVLIGDTWVPFDLTYNQYGYVDASHIILDKSPHIRNSSVNINTYGYGYKFASNVAINNDFTLVDKKELIENTKFDIELNGPQELGFGSYGYIKVNVKNIENNYNILFLQISKTKEVELLSSQNQMIIFKPDEEKEVYIRYKITDDLSPNYYYTFPFAIYNDEIEYKFDVEVREDYHNIKQIALPQKEEEKKQLSNNDLLFDCNYLFQLPQNLIICSVQNPNNYEINNINICLKEDCKKTDLKLNELQTISFETPNFEETIKYSYNGNQDSITLKLGKPEFTTTHNISNQHLIINYEIENYYDNLHVDVYQNETLFISLNKEYSKFQIPLEYGMNNIEIKLQVKNQTIDSKTYNINVEKPKLSFIDKIVKWFKELFN